MIAMQKLDEEKLHSFECTHIYIVKQLVKADAGPLQAVLLITWMNIFLEKVDNIWASDSTQPKPKDSELYVKDIQGVLRYTIYLLRALRSVQMLHKGNIGLYSWITLWKKWTKILLRECYVKSCCITTQNMKIRMVGRAHT